MGSFLFVVWMLPIVFVVLRSSEAIATRSALLLVASLFPGLGYDALEFLPASRSVSQSPKTQTDLPAAKELKQPSPAACATRGAGRGRDTGGFKQRCVESQRHADAGMREEMQTDHKDSQRHLEEWRDV